MPSLSAASSLNWRGAATVTDVAPPDAMSCASSSPVGPAPMTRALEPGRISSRSSPCIAQAAGSLKTATSRVEPLDREGEVLGRRHVLGEEAREIAAHALHVATQDQPAREAVIAVPAVDVGVDRDLLAEGELLDAIAQRVDRAHQLVPGDEREPRLELAFMDVQVGAAHADLIDLDSNLAGRRLRGRDVTNCELRGAS